MKIVEEEADETIYWIEILQDAELLMAESVGNVRKEAKEILAMVVASINTKLKNLKS